MSNLLQLVNEVLRRSGQQEVNTLLNAPTPALQTIDFLNETYFEMLQRLKVKRLCLSASITTTPDTAAYNIAPSNDIDRVLADSVRDISHKKTLKEVAYTYPQARNENETGQPQFFYRMDNQIYFYPVPNGNYTIQYRYLVTPHKLATDEESPAIPEHWEQVLVLGTQSRLEKFLGEGGSENYLLYRDGLTQIKSLSPLKPHYRMKGFYRGFNNS